ncbi:MAG: hypothetical protein ACLS6O_09670 [Bifidobacterium sp.]
MAYLLNALDYASLPARVILGETRSSSPSTTRRDSGSARSPSNSTSRC